MKNTVFISGAFNVVHPGHLRLFKFAKELGKKLIVGVLSDELIKQKTLLKDKLRIEGVKSIQYVDEAILIKNSINKTISKIKPSIVVKGKEHENINNEEEQVLRKYGGKLIFSSGEITFSSLELLNKEYYSNENTRKMISNKFYKSHQIQIKNITKKINSFKKIKTLVIGDSIIDEYLTCENLGLSQEDPSIVVSPINKSKFVGGASIVASHCAALGSKVDFVSVTGKDEGNKFLKEKLISYGVKPVLFEDISRPTTIKQRYLTENKTLLKVSYLHQNSIPKIIEKKILSFIKKKIKKYNLIIFSDFNYGCLSQSLVENIISLSKKNKTFVTADCQSSSQIGKIEKYNNIDLVTPTERETRICLKNNDDGLVVISEKLRKFLNCNHVILKLGSEGIIIQTENNRISDGFETDRLPSLNLIPRDVAGAGDSLLAGSSLYLASGGNIWEASIVGSYLASIQIGRMGNIPIKTKDLLSKIK